MPTIDELERLLGEATQGGWRAVDNGCDAHGAVFYVQAVRDNWASAINFVASARVGDSSLGAGMGESDARLIVAMHSVLPDLIARARRLEAIEAKLRPLLKEHGTAVDMLANAHDDADESAAMDRADMLAVRIVAHLHDLFPAKED